MAGICLKPSTVQELAEVCQKHGLPPSFYKRYAKGINKMMTLKLTWEEANHISGMIEQELNSLGKMDIMDVEQELQVQEEVKRLNKIGNKLAKEIDSFKVLNAESEE